MPQLEDHLRLKLLINGVFQVKPSSISVKFESGAQEVTTLEGLAGKTPGSGKVTISVKAAIAIGGPEASYFDDCVEGTYTDMQVPFGTKSYIGKGWYDSCEVSQSTNANTEVDFTWTGTFSKPK